MTAATGAGATASAPPHAPDETDWTVTVSQGGIVQVSCPCLCGLDGCWWHAASYRDSWLNVGPPAGDGPNSARHLIVGGRALA